MFHIFAFSGIIFKIRTQTPVLGLGVIRYPENVPVILVKAELSIIILPDNRNYLVNRRVDS